MSDPRLDKFIGIFAEKRLLSDAEVAELTAYAHELVVDQPPIPLAQMPHHPWIALWSEACKDADINCSDSLARLRQLHAAIVKPAIVIGFLERNLKPEKV